MHRQNVLTLLEDYKPTDRVEESSRQRIIEFVKVHSDCFERSCIPGHITGSAWLINRQGSHVLLTHHGKLHMWLQLGGHCDGQSNVLDVSLREAQEESGIHAIEPVSGGIFDVDVHLIPERPGEPAHFHYDISFLMRVTDDSPYVMSDESNALQWFDQNPATFPSSELSMRRMFDKWCALV